MLHDFDRLTLANDSTSLLTDPGLVGRRKTRAMAEWTEARRFRTSLVERLFPGGIKVAGDEPRLALGAVDNAQARAAYQDAGFDCVVEAGLGAGPSEYLALRLHTFPIDAFSPPNTAPKTLVSLCCRTGYADFSKQFTESGVCQSLVAPFHSADGAIASQFCQSFFAHHLLIGETARIAFRHSPDAIPGSTRFRLWEKGKVTGGQAHRLTSICSRATVPTSHPIGRSSPPGGRQQAITPFLTWKRTTRRLKYDAPIAA